MYLLIFTIIIVFAINYHYYWYCMILYVITITYCCCSIFMKLINTLSILDLMSSGNECVWAVRKITGAPACFQLVLDVNFWIRSWAAQSIRLDSTKVHGDKQAKLAWMQNQLRVCRNQTPLAATLPLAILPASLEPFCMETTVPGLSDAGSALKSNRKANAACHNLSIIDHYSTFV